MLESWKTAEEGIQGLRDVDMPAWIYAVRAEEPAEFCFAGRPRGHTIHQGHQECTDDKDSSLVGALLCRPVLQS